MTYALATPAHPFPALSPHDPPPPAFPRRDAVLAAILVFSATALLHAQDRIEAWTQDWVPTILEVPADAILLTDREIGSTVRMFSFSTGADVDALFETWEAALRDGGFPIDQGADDLLERSIEFSGRGITNAKIVAGVTW